MNNQSKKIALFSAPGMGDGLLWLVIAHNLALNGFDITLYNDPIADLQSWIKQVIVKKNPEMEKVGEELKGYRLIISDDRSWLTDHHENLRESCVKGNVVVFSLAHFNRHLELFGDLFVNELIDPKLNHIIFAHGFVIQKIDRKGPILQNILSFLENQLRLKNIEYENLLQPLVGLHFKKWCKRIVLHPESKQESKNWPAKKYIKLAKKLKKNGFDPVFSVSPSEREAWETLLKGQFELPNFKSVSDLCSFIYESGYFIGNDSGPGHLASCLGIPTLTILKKKDYIWRPGWSDAKTIAPPIKIKIGKTKHWKIFLSVNRVYRAFC